MDEQEIVPHGLLMEAQEVGNNHPLLMFSITWDTWREVEQPGQARSRGCKLTLDPTQSPGRIELLRPEGRLLGSYELKGDRLSLYLNTKPGDHRWRPEHVSSLAPVNLLRLAYSRLTPGDPLLNGREALPSRRTELVSKDPDSRLPHLTRENIRHAQDSDLKALQRIYEDQKSRLEEIMSSSDNPGDHRNVALPYNFKEF